MYFDTHCHLNSEQLYEKRADYVRHAMDCGVDHMVVVGYNLKASELAVAISQEFENVYAAVGIGPEDCLDTDAEELAKLEALLTKPKVVALGEIGLDYHWDTVPPQNRKRSFEPSSSSPKSINRSWSFIAGMRCRILMRSLQELVSKASCIVIAGVSKWHNASSSLVLRSHWRDR